MLWFTGECVTKRSEGSDGSMQGYRYCSLGQIRTPQLLLLVCMVGEYLSPQSNASDVAASLFTYVGQPCWLKGCSDEWGRLMSGGVDEDHHALL